jgi:hypothetical protein
MAHSGAAALVVMVGAAVVLVAGQNSELPKPVPTLQHNIFVKDKNIGAGSKDKGRMGLPTKTQKKIMKNR